MVSKKRQILNIDCVAIATPVDRGANDGYLAEHVFASRHMVCGRRSKGDLGRVLVEVHRARLVSQHWQNHRWHPRHQAPRPPEMDQKENRRYLLDSDGFNVLAERESAIQTSSNVQDGMNF